MSRVGTKVSVFTDISNSTDQYERAQTLYFNWLCVMVHIDDYLGKQWYILAKTLHDIEFYWSVNNDDNRATDGVKLREVWLTTLKNEAEDLGVSVDIPLDALNGPCTMLEMMIGLASRIESDIMQADRYGNRTQMWFWYMVHNLLSDANMDGCMWDCMWWIDKLRDDMALPDGLNAVRIMVIRCLDRDYEPNGRGGCLFPVNSYDVDRREVELWYQAQDWIGENFRAEII